ncbi:MAG: OmpH family outer membrane protein [Spirochaetales bacterium]|nr:OmpH family outer membrane protein [Spirochaetales bacterium]
MKKKLLIAIICLTVFSFSLAAEQLSKIGLVNFSKIIEDYFAESSAWREIDAMRSQYEEGKNEIMEDIDQLKLRKLEAQNINNEVEILRLEERIYQKQEYLKEFHNIWSSRINSKIENVSTSSSFTSEIYNVIKYVAETQGYSVIMRTSDPNVLWYSQDVDVTDLVLERLRRQAANSR